MTDLTEHDIYLFREGTHFRTYDRLGAHLGARGGPDSLVQACELNFAVLEEKVVRRFKEDPRRAIYLETRDLLFLR